MKRCLADVNVWLALLAAAHEHHRVAREWYAGLESGSVGMPRLVQLSVVRLLCNRTVMDQHALSTKEAWAIVTGLLVDERVEFLPEPSGAEDVLHGYLQYNVPTPRLLNDAYLAALAYAGLRQLVTLDRGFTQFQGLDLKLL
jgi:toxin-antitoxin system PIN domain toxin